MSLKDRYEGLKGAVKASIPHVPPPLESGERLNTAVSNHMALWLAQNGNAKKGDRRYIAEANSYIAYLNKSGEVGLAPTDDPNSRVGKFSRMLDDIAESPLGKLIRG